MIMNPLSSYSTKTKSLGYSPFISDDSCFKRYEKRRIKIAKNIKRLSILILLSIVYSFSGLVILSTFTPNIFVIIFSFLDIIIGFAGIVWFSFFLAILYSIYIDLEKNTICYKIFRR